MTNREWRHQPLVKDANGISSIASCADAFRNLNNSRIIRRIRDFRILDVDVSPHLNSYKTVSTPLRCRFDCASILFDFICPVHVVGCLTVLIECRDNCQDMLILRGQIACSEYWTRRTAGSLCAKTVVCIRQPRGKRLL